MTDLPLACAPTDRVPLPREAWYVGTASTRLTDAPVAVVIHDQPIALFRGEDGIARAVHDRCPHRGVALSLGAVSGDTIACAYHGWRFGGDGQCPHVPSLRPDQSVKAAAVRAYPAVERDGYVWLWTGDGEPQEQPRRIEKFDRYGWVQGATALACEAIMPIENNLDICHAAFTHPHQHPQWFQVQAAGFRPTRYDLATNAGSVTVGAAGITLRFDLPDRVTVAFGDSFRLVLHHVPTTPGRCIQHWMLCREPAAGAGVPVWSDQEPEILAQDRRVLESAQVAYAREGDAFERSVEADATTLAARRLVRRAAQGQQPERTADVRQLLVLS